MLTKSLIALIGLCFLYTTSSLITFTVVYFIGKEIQCDVKGSVNMTINNIKVPVDVERKCLVNNIYIMLILSSVAAIILSFILILIIISRCVYKNMVIQQNNVIYNKP